MGNCCYFGIFSMKFWWFNFNFKNNNKFVNSRVSNTVRWFTAPPLGWMQFSKNAECTAYGMWIRNSWRYVVHYAIQTNWRQSKPNRVVLRCAYQKIKCFNHSTTFRLPCTVLSPISNTIREWRNECVPHINYSFEKFQSQRTFNADAVSIFLSSAR